MHYTKYFKTDIYPVNICFVISDEPEKVTAMDIDPTDIDDIENAVDLYATTFYDGRTFNKRKLHHSDQEKEVPVSCMYVVFNPVNEVCDLTYGTLVHELVHVKNKIFKDIGMKSKYDNDEQEAYLMGYLMDVLMKFFQDTLQEENMKNNDQIELHTKTYELRNES